MARDALLFAARVIGLADSWFIRSRSLARGTAFGLVPGHGAGLPVDHRTSAVATVPSVPAPGHRLGTPAEGIEASLVGDAIAGA